MGRSLLPPQGFISNIPICLLFNQQIPESAKVTWLQLRSLAWGVEETPEFSAEQFEDWTGKSQSTLYAHMRLLRSGGALSWRQGSKSTLIVYGFMQPDQPSDQNCDAFQFSRNLEKPTILEANLNTKEKEALSSFPENRKTAKPIDPLFEAVADVTGRTPPRRDWAALTSVERGILNSATGQLRKAKATEQQVRDFPRWFEILKHEDYRYKRKLEPWDLPKLWSKYRNGHSEKVKREVNFIT